MVIASLTLQETANVFQNVFTILQSHQQCMGDPYFSHPYNHLVLSIFTFYFSHSDGYIVIFHCGVYMCVCVCVCVCMYIYMYI